MADIPEYMAISDDEEDDDNDWGHLVVYRKVQKAVAEDAGFMQHLDCFEHYRETSQALIDYRFSSSTTLSDLRRRLNLVKNEMKSSIVVIFWSRCFQTELVPMDILPTTDVFRNLIVPEVFKDLLIKRLFQFFHVNDGLPQQNIGPIACLIFGLFTSPRHIYDFIINLTNVHYSSTRNILALRLLRELCMKRVQFVSFDDVVSDILNFALLLFPLLPYRLSTLELLESLFVYHIPSLDKRSLLERVLKVIVMIDVDLLEMEVARSWKRVGKRLITLYLEETKDIIPDSISRYVMAFHPRLYLTKSLPYKQLRRLGRNEVQEDNLEEAQVPSDEHVHKLEEPSDEHVHYLEETLMPSDEHVQTLKEPSDEHVQTLEEVPSNVEETQVQSDEHVLKLEEQSDEHVKKQEQQSDEHVKKQEEEPFNLEETTQVPSDERVQKLEESSDELVQKQEELSDEHVRNQEEVSM